jgi:hypothetical protein
MSQFLANNKRADLLWAQGANLWNEGLAGAGNGELISEAVETLMSASSAYDSITNQTSNLSSPDTNANINTTNRLWSERNTFLAYCRSDAGEFEEAEMFLRRALAMNVNNDAAWRELLLLYESDMKDLAKAKALVSDSLADVVGAERAANGWKNEWQRPGYMYNSLEAKAWWSEDALRFPWVAKLEEMADVVQSECFALVPTNSNSNSNSDSLNINNHEWPSVGGDHRETGRGDASVLVGDWREIVILGNGERANVAPRTRAFLQAEVPDAVKLCEMGGGEVILSMLKPHSRITPHCAPTNLRLTAHLGLKVPAAGAGVRAASSEDDCKISVGGEWRQWEEGKVLLFDDSFEHEVKNDTDEVRIVLLIRFFHPDLNADSDRREALQRAIDMKASAEDSRWRVPN